MTVVARKQSRFLVRQKMALAALGAAVVLVMAYLSYLTFRDQPLGEYVAGEHFQVLENPRRLRGETVEVMEFFSYGCLHCYNFDPDLNNWVEDRGDSIRFLRVPAVASGHWRLLARAYYTMQALGLPQRYHRAFFKAIHEGRRNFNSAGKIQGFFEEAGVTADTFAATFNSDDISSRLNQADRIARRLKVAAVPTLVVQGKYLVSPSRDIGLLRMLDITSHIVDKEVPEPAADGT